MARLARKTVKLKLTRAQVAAMRAYCKGREDVLAFYLYGSYGTPYHTALSDIDLAFLPMPGTKLDLDDELEVETALGRIAGSDDVNFINLRRVPVHLQFRVLEEGRLLYCRDEILLADFVAQVICRHADFAPDLAAIYRDYDFSLREEFL